MILFARYTLFLNEQRPKLKKKSKDMHFSEMTKILGNQWSGMTQDDKQVNCAFFSKKYKLNQNGCPRSTGPVISKCVFVAKCHGYVTRYVCASLFPTMVFDLGLILQKNHKFGEGGLAPK